MAELNVNQLLLLNNLKYLNWITNASINISLKKLLTCILVLAIILLNGCSKVHHYTMDEKKEIVLKYLEDKYEEEFEGVSYAPSEILKLHDEFWVYPKNGSKENDLFVVTGYYLKKLKKYEMHDAFFGILIHDKYFEYVNNLALTIIDEFYLSVDTKSNNPC